ncbi:MAG: hypothetical protein MRZ79_12430, partial [Bacteroidia bacterium]|nr:hypothetical protein [Bacteroidia bacterium]
IITPIAFDLKNPKIIENKYTSWFGKLTLLENTAQQKDFQFDLLISKPTLKVSPELNNAYLNGVEVLGSLKTRKRIILEEDFENYIAQAAKEINAQNSSQ